MTYVITLLGYVPLAREDGLPWTQAQVYYATSQADAVAQSGSYVLLGTLTLTPVDSDPSQPRVRNFTIANSPAPTGWFQVIFLDALGNKSLTTPIPWPPGTVFGSASPSQLSARYAVRHRIRDGVPALDANPVPFNMVRLEDLSDQIGTPATPTQTVFQVRYSDIPTQRYMNAQVCPGTLVAFVDGSWTPTTPMVDVDTNGNFTLPSPPVSALRITYAWAYLADGEVDQMVDEARQWLREFASVNQIPDGLVPALVSYAASRCLTAIARSATLAPVKAGDSEVDWSKLGAAYLAEATAQYNTAIKERESFYTQGPEALDPTVADFGSVAIGTYTPLR